MERREYYSGPAKPDDLMYAGLNAMQADARRAVEHGEALTRQLMKKETENSEIKERITEMRKRIDDMRAAHLDVINHGAGSRWLRAGDDASAAAAPATSESAERPDDRRATRSSTRLMTPTTDVSR